MSRSRKLTTKKPHEELSKENAKLTQEISELEDALVLHQRFIDEDRTSVPGIIRQEVGGSRWQYGGGGRLHTFRSKNDLAETQEVRSHRSGRGNNTKSATMASKMEEKSNLEVVPSNNAGPRCLNEDATIKSKAIAAGTASKKHTSKSQHKRNSRSGGRQQNSWSMESGKLRPHSKEYDTVMHDLFGEGGFPLKDKYSVQSASVGVSLFAEKDDTDITEMKSKVLKRASAVLIMRPKSAASSQSQYAARQNKALSTFRNPKLARKGEKKFTGGQMDSKTDRAESDPELKLDLNTPGAAHRKKSGTKNSKTKTSVESEMPSAPDQKAESGTTTPYDNPVDKNATQSAQDHPAEDVKDTDDDDVSDVLALFSQDKDPNLNQRQGNLLKESGYPMATSVWDKNAMPKPWDKWGNLKDSALNTSKSSTQEKEKPNSKTSLTLQRSYPKPNRRPSTGRSWNPSWPRASARQEKRPQSANHAAQRHSWTGEYYPEAEKVNKSTSQPKSESWADNLTPAKQKAVADWLDKHVNHSCEEELSSDPSFSTSTVFDTDIGSEYISINNLADITAQAAGVDCFERDNRVAAWLGSLGLKDVETYEKIFVQHQIDLVDLPSLTVPVLQHIGINKVGAVMKIMRGVDGLKAQITKTTTMVKKQEDLDKEERFGSLHQKLTEEMENPDSVALETVEAASGSRSQVDRHGKGKDQPGGQSSQRANKKTEEKKLSAAEKVKCLRSSLKELYLQLSGEQADAENNGEGEMSNYSRETSPFECTNLQPEGRHSDTSTNLFNVNSVSDTGGKQLANHKDRTGEDMEEVHTLPRATAGRAWAEDGSPERDFLKAPVSKAERDYFSGGSTSALTRDVHGDPEMPDEKVLNRAPLPQTDKGHRTSAVHAGYGKKAARASQSRSNSSVTKATGKVRDRPSSGKVPQIKSASSKIDTGVERLAQRLAERQRKREQEEEMMEQRLQRLRQQRNVMAARHKLRERSRSMERECQCLSPDPRRDSKVRKGRRKSDSGLDETAYDITDDIIADIAYENQMKEGECHTRTLLSPDLPSQMQEMAAMFQGEAEDPKMQGMTLSAVRKLKDRLHYLEQSLLHTGIHSSLTSAAAAAAHIGEPVHGSAHAGSHGELLSDFEDLGSPGAEGASGGRTETWSKNYRPGLRPEISHRSGHDSNLDVVTPYQRQLRALYREQQEGPWPHSLSQHFGVQQRSPSQGRSRRLPLTYRTSSRDRNRNATSSGHRNSTTDYNDNARTEPPPSCVDSEKEPAAPKAVVDLALQGVTVGKEETTQQKEGGTEASLTKPQSAAPHLSMSKRQLLDEIRREKDEHRKNVRHFKSELTRLQHKDPVKKSEIEESGIEFKESDLIGEGAFSQVFRGKYQGAEVAIKRLKTPLSSHDKNYFAAEVSLLRDLRHPRVVLLVGVSTSDHLPIMVLEFMAGRDLYTLIHDASRPALDHAEFYQIARDISSGMVYLHNHRPSVLHLDLKSMNVLLTSSHRAKIADFGFSKLKHDADKKAGKPAKNREVKGSPAWMAPELLQGGEVTPKADVFSFGVILWEMMSRNRPYEGCSVFQILERVRTDKRPEIPESCPPDLSGLISKCWHQNPAVRPKFKEVLKQIEDMSYPPGWRALFKAAGVPNEALEDLASTRQIISLVSSTMESSVQDSTLEQGNMVESESQQQISATQSQDPQQKQAGKKVKSVGKRTPRARNSLETCDYSLSDEDTLDLEDSLDIIVHNSLEEVSPRSKSSGSPNSADSLQNSLESSSSTLKFSQKLVSQKQSKTSHNHEAPFSKRTQRSDVPSLPLESLRSPTPQAVRVSVSSVYDSIEAGGPASQESARSGHDPELSARSAVPGRHLTPIVPRLSLGEITEGKQSLKTGSLNKQNCLSPIGTQSKPAEESADVEGREESEDVGKKASPVMSARQARRLGLSRSSSFSKERHIASPRSSKISTVSLSDDKHKTETKSQMDTEEIENYLESKLCETNTNNNSTKPPIQGKPGPAGTVTPRPKERTKLPQPVSKVSGLASKDNVQLNVHNTAAGETQISKPGADVKASHSSQSGESHRLSDSCSSSVTKQPPPPPPPPPPPLPTLTPSGPQISVSATATQGLENHTQNLASVHQELLQRSQQESVGKSTERRTKKKRNFLKERYRGNPHISVDASALQEQKEHLRSATLPHPSQLQDVPASGQMFMSMTDLLRKAMGDRRFAMGENVGASNSQELTDVSWSVQDD